MKSKNLTITLDEELLSAGKRYAKMKGSSITELFREFLKSKVIGDTGAESADQIMEALDAAVGNSGRRGWSRSDAYDT